MRSALVPRPSGVLGWLRQRDRGLVALRRATRTAVVMPAMFALGDVVLDDPQLATFAAFGSFAMLLLVDFPGPMRSRLLAQAALGVAGAVLVCVGTLLSTTTWAAALAMGVVAFGVVFAGVVSSVLAGATTSLLLAFILPISIAGPASAIPHRVAGWGLAAVAALLAVRFLWPAPERDPIRGAAIAACRAVAARLRAEVSGTGLGTAVADADDAVKRLHDTFFATPYRPTGLSTAARAVVRLVDELQWLSEIAGGPPQPPVDDVAARAVTVAAA